MISAPPAMVTNQEMSRISTPKTLQKQIDGAIGNHRTSASMINAIVGGLSTKGNNLRKEHIYILVDYFCSVLGQGKAKS